MLSLSARRDLAGSWALSLNGDSGAQRNWAANWVTANSGRDSMWNVNLHRTFPLATDTFSLFLGYESAGWSSVFPAVSTTSQSGRYTGARFGGDLTVRTGNNLTITGWVATGLGGTVVNSWPGVTPNESISGSYFEWGTIVGWSVSPTWSVDVGYRGLSMSTSGPTASFVQYKVGWTGWTIGVTARLP